MVIKKLDMFEAKMIQDGKEMYAVYLQAVKKDRGKFEEISKRLTVHLKIANQLPQQTNSTQRHFVLSRALQNERKLMKSDLYEHSSKCLANEYKQIEFQASGQFEETLSHATNLGELISRQRVICFVPAMPIETTSLRDYSVVLVKQLRQTMTPRTHTQAIRCQFVDETRIAITDKAKLVHIVDTENEHRHRQVKLKNQPWDMALLKDQNMIAFSHPGERKISLYSLDAEYPFVNALAQMGDDLLVCLGAEDVSQWSLCRISLQGKVIQTKLSDGNGRRFESFWYFAVEGNSIYQSCSSSDTLYKFDIESGTPYFQYGSDQLTGLAGVAVDNDKNVYVCGLVSRNIHILTENGEALNIFKPPGCYTPLDLACNLDRGYFVVVDKKKKSGPFMYTFKVAGHV